MSLIGTSQLGSESFTPPGPGDFNLPPIGPDRTFDFLGQEMYLGVTKPMLQAVLDVGVLRQRQHASYSALRGRPGAVTGRAGAPRPRPGP